MAQDRQYRKDKRQKTIKGGRIIFSDDFCAVKCVVRNMSKTGANLRTDNSIDCPDQFKLVLHEGLAFDCIVTWRRANLIGVKFADQPGTLANAAPGNATEADS